MEWQLWIYIRIFIGKLFKTHQQHNEIEYYLCGPPAMIQAGLAMLKKLNISDKMIAFVEF